MTQPFPQSLFVQLKITVGAPLGLVVLGILMSAPLSAQIVTATLHTSETRNSAVQAMASSLDRQRSSVASMEASIAAQRASLGRQARNSPLGNLTNAPWSMRFTPYPAPSACDRLPPEEIDSLVRTAADSAAILPDLVRSVMKQESGFRPCAVSAKGAMGLMQLMPPTADDLGVRDAFDPQENAIGGAKFLRQLMDYYGGDVSLALGAYNAGPRKVDAARGVPAIPETQNFVRQVLSLLPGLSLSAPLQSAPPMVPVSTEER